MLLKIYARTLETNPDSPKDGLSLNEWNALSEIMEKSYVDIVEKIEKDTKFDFGKSFIKLMDFESEKFNYFLEQIRSSYGFAFMFMPYLKKQELAEVKAYILQSVTEFPYSYCCESSTKRDRELNDKAKILNPKSRFPVKIYEKISTKKFRTMKKDFIYEHPEGFIISSELNELFRKNNITGYQSNPIMSCNGKNVHSDMYCFTSLNLLGPSEKDLLRYEGKNIYTQEPTLPFEGTLTYAEDGLGSLKDVNYPCEATERDTSRANIIVSARFKEICQEEKIRGVSFLPVFEKGSKIYKEYISLIRKLAEILYESNPKNRIGYSEMDPSEILKLLKS